MQVPTVPENQVTPSSPPTGTSARESAPFKVPILIAVIALLLIGGWWLLHHQKTNPGGGLLSNDHPNGKIVGDLPSLRIHVSNTIGAQLAPALAMAYLKSIGATNIVTKQIDKNESDIEGTPPGETKPLVIEIFAHGSKTAFTDLSGDKTDIGMASRRIEPAELKATESKGDLTSSAAEHVLGLDGVAVIVNKSRRLSGLTKSKLADIYSGATTDWRDIDGTPGPIHVFARDDNSGTWDTFKSLVLKDKPLVKGAVRLEDSKELSDRVSADPDAIGFIGLPYILNAKALAISETQASSGKTTQTTPLYPNRLTVATEDYPLSRRLYFYLSPNGTNALAQKFIGFALSKAGQDVVGDNGFVSQTPVAVNPECTACPARYKSLTAGKNRMTTNFHFETGQSTLESKALLDIGRVADVLADLKYSGSGIVLLGFADNVGSDEVCLRLSKQRAEVVAQEFRMHGINPDVVDGMGKEMPVATNDTPQGREKNRRVEIWINR